VKVRNQLLISLASPFRFGPAHRAATARCRGRKERNRGRTGEEDEGKERERETKKERVEARAMRLFAAAQPSVGGRGWSVRTLVRGLTGASTYIREKGDGGFARLADQVRDAPFVSIASPYAFTKRVFRDKGAWTDARTEQREKEGYPRATGATKCRRTTIYRERVK